MALLGLWRPPTLADSAYGWQAPPPIDSTSGKLNVSSLTHNSLHVWVAKVDVRHKWEDSAGRWAWAFVEVRIGCQGARMIAELP
eukprot:11191092-Lingulodinium_polyedra.AAC.1